MRYNCPKCVYYEDDNEHVEGDVYECENCDRRWLIKDLGPIPMKEGSPK